MKTIPKRPKIGSVIEIEVPSGFAYAQCTNKHVGPPTWGFLIRVFPTIHKTPPTDFSEIVKGPELFRTFFPVGAAVARKIVKIVAQETVPEAFQAFPLFRASNRTPEGYKGNWWLWNGEKSWYIGELTVEQRQYPIQSICNDTFLIERIEKGWRSIDNY